MLVPNVISLHHSLGVWCRSVRMRLLQEILMLSRPLLLPDPVVFSLNVSGSGFFVTVLLFYLPPLGSDPCGASLWALFLLTHGFKLKLFYKWKG